MRRRATLRVGAADDAPERHADEIANVVIARLGRRPPALVEATSRIQRATTASEPQPAGDPGLSSRIRPSTEAVIRRRIGVGQSGNEIKKTANDARFVAHGVAADRYSLQPIDGGAAIEVAHDDDEYEVVGPLSADDITARVQPTVHPDAGYDVLEWTAQMRSKLGADDFEGARGLIERMMKLAGGLPTSGVALDDKQLETRLKTLPYGQQYASVYRGALLMPATAVTQRFVEVFTKSPIPAQKAGHDFAVEPKEALAARMATALKTERRKTDLVPTITRLLEADRGVVAAQERKAYEASQPTVMSKPEVHGLYVELATEKFRHDDHPDKYDAAITDSGLPRLDAWTRAALLDHLEGTMVNVNPPVPDPLDVAAVKKEEDRVKAERKEVVKRLKARTVDQIISASLAKKATRMKHLFEERPDVFDGVAAVVKDEKVHASLLAIIGGEKHSISDINDYVGDKLNDPLMKWVVGKGIKVEVHATSTLASFAKMRAEGFTDVIEAPSSHEGTKKYIVAKPDTGEAKVVFQTLPGASYAIQTVGAFLFYELYSPGGPLADVVALAKGPWTYDTYKARSLLSDDTVKHIATYLLVAHGEDNLTAAVHYTVTAPPIDKAGAIVLDGIPAEAIKVTKATVTRLDPANLSVHKEDVDYKAMYLDLLRSNGITKALIAAIGRKGELRKMFDAMGVGEPLVDITLPNFNATLYTLKRDPDPVNVVCFQISPDFFGDRSGFLAQALTEIEVKHITFVGTAGALAPHIKKFDVMVPEELANFANRLPTKGDTIEAGQRSPNAAFGMFKELEASADLGTTPRRSGGLHLNVHSPITESKAMIEWMKTESVQSVDCEAGFIADALKGSAVSLYAIYFISDVPGTEESIGMGGITGAGGATASTVVSGPKVPEASERMVREIIKKAIGREIERADHAVAPEIVKVTKDGKIAVVAETASGFKKAEITVSVALPSIAIASDAIGVLRTFANSLATVDKDATQENRPKITAAVVNMLNKKAQDFYATHKVKLIWTMK